MTKRTVAEMASKGETLDESIINRDGKDYVVKLVSKKEIPNIQTPFRIIAHRLHDPSNNDYIGLEELDKCH